MLVRKDFGPFKSKVWLSSPTMHGDEQKWVDEAIRTNWGYCYIMDKILAAQRGAEQC